ncbi:leucine-rich repeat domain-containing protein, partial [Vibrio sp. FNV 38]|nr:leucine-rich repeat domain-containing protein [Vibrio sp. FNV 38]
YAFAESGGLEEVTIADGLTLLEGRVFENCAGLTEVRLPETLEQIKAYAFNGCTSLEEIRLPDSVTTLSADVFYNCGKLTQANYPAGWETTNDYQNRIYYGDSDGDYRSPFRGSAIRRIRVPEGVTAIPKHA